jgi:serine-type D-Ala-D-Ala carboxypeptidase (penicillin-binding protein 5/6)
MRRRRRVRPGHVALLVLLFAASSVAGWLLAAGHTSDSPPAAAVVNAPPAVKHRVEKPRPSGYAPPPGIDLFGARPVHVRFKKKPRAGLLFDVNTGQVLWARRPLRRLSIASITKIMTAILVVERTRPREKVHVSKQALHYSGSGVGVLPKKRPVPVEGLLAGMLLPSGNDAAIALAGHLAGGSRRFARLMNERARAMGLGCTHYVSPEGLSDRNRSCAADLAALSRVAIAKRRIARLSRRKQVEIPFPIKSGKLWLNNTNPLLRTGYPGTIGLKTGYTQKAGHCFVAIVRRGSREFGVVLLHSPNTERQAKKLFNAAFDLRG